MSYEFKVGDEGLTRNGQKYRVIAIEDALLPRPVVVIIEGGIRTYINLRFRNGQLYESVTSGHDLMPPAVTVYLNVYRCPDGTFYVSSYATAVEARAKTSYGAFAIAQPFIFTPGQEK